MHAIYICTYFVIFGVPETFLCGFDKGEIELQLFYDRLKQNQARREHNKH